MKEKTIQFENLTLQFEIEQDNWQVRLPKSQTAVHDVRQMDVMLHPSDFFAPLTITEEKDAYRFTFSRKQKVKTWNRLLQLHRNEKLRLVCNMIKLERYLNTRITFFLHPENLVVDDNLMPIIIYRGIRKLVPPYEMSETDFLKQLKCFTIALFSKKYNFEQLYHGSLQNATETDFQRQVSEITDLEELKDFLYKSYEEEQRKTEQTMVVVPTKRFRLFKQLSIIMIIVSVLLAIPVIYYGFIKTPYQNNLLEAHGQYLASSYGDVISTLEDEDPEKLPTQTMYILAHSYINVENLSDAEKEVILKNVSLKSDPDYLAYWIYNGRGEFDTSIEKAKYIDDPILIMHGLIQKIEQAKNNPDLTGSEREETVKKLQDELQKYREEYDLQAEEEKTAPVNDTETEDNSQTQQDPQSDKQSNADENKQEETKNGKEENEKNETDKQEASKKKEE
ncbi:type VII secretion protein EssB [Virgibacillus pantothenticus]|uniref:type VII secretion protein EssB n=1 Tax=Virgibacillus TaxID=84406 RepID=UPI0009097BB8|nr:MULTISPECIES: type VII secretion protein EssB [Virgibacillus]API93668.1 type VII secretion protein EssB [Virgibacillus sp. 6R]MBS7429933.1 type VII secretion protein EssB [Virgibacillus sp. 19R1-5]MBU8564969.1 type VII secretion protein EssB [Virgibacillus pantothenticus]MBU8599277.1 type VII secretion protein EssB [Virgibacillus pantothenticus]MBU8633320.1 type VII secretion protein EssB [Virgibacillus pantothenticus]